MAPKDGLLWIPIGESTVAENPGDTEEKFTICIIKKRSKLPNVTSLEEEVPQNAKHWAKVSITNVINDGCTIVDNDIQFEITQNKVGHLTKPTQKVSYRIQSYKDGTASDNASGRQQGWTNLID